MSVVLALLAAYGVFLAWTSLALGWRGFGPGTARSRGRRRDAARRWLEVSGLVGIAPRELAAVMATVAVVGGALGFAFFGGVLAALVSAGLCAAIPVGSYRARRERRLTTARAAWPRMIEEMRVQIGALGRSIPQALFEVGRAGPEELRPAFAAAEREWLVSTDFARTVGVLKDCLADPTADAACETLLVAHQVGGSDIDRRLAALVEDRIAEIQGRRNALAQQAGVRFARRFVAVVPLGMALAGLSIGTGRAAFETPLGQVLVLVGLAAMAACWVWAGRLMRLPEAERVLG
ncbi:MAG: type II secretion system F family protein [Acidimicrobiales bacterium]